MALDPAARLRPQITFLGALAGLAGWLFWSVLYDQMIGELRLFMLFAAASYGTFFMVLALVGPARFWPSLPWSIGLSSLGAGLLYWASFRYASVDAFLSAGYPLVGFWLFLFVATPFVAAQLRSTGGWSDYPALFDLSWRIFVRYLSAVLFTALFWGLLALSDALLNLVGLELMSTILRYQPLPWVLTGAVFGLALAVVHELRDYLSPFLVLQLLRLLLPVVLVVVLVFLLALPIQGLSHLVGNFSAAATLMSAALAAIVLITVAVDRDSTEEVHLPWMRAIVQILALLVPILAALAIYALWLRLHSYGWTPERLMAATVAGMVLLYGLSYGAAVALRRNWSSRIRQANVGLALLTLAVIVVWLSPLLVPERIAARDQLARYRDGILPASDVPLREMAQDWGKAGEEALEQLREDPALAPGFAMLAGERAVVAEDLRASVATQMPVLGGEPLTEAQLGMLDDDTLAQWQQACGRAVVGGPGCALIFGDFMPDLAETSAILLLNTGEGSVTARSLRVVDGRLQFWGYAIDLSKDRNFDLPFAILEDLHAGKARVAVPGIKALIVGTHALFPHN
ncbi:hypothetical protein P775_10010 [Puniceibacterium antarcticum]|uniref:DUF4153 domain-containing protein n=1 Tax=Puniceibacterium antarcticum TaxID=1206336 RepID=A0A2G8RFB7_9RHOB|nr:DUF4153 domain-containing protein [Puniceibacterium antarcticum]PIL20275.1 hypothetical protein P775_10010 [Puniceibacterium antarcticum]